MPLVAHSSLPSFERLREDGEEILELERAHDQDIRELHIGLCNIMPDAALEATERQFMRLIGSSNRIAQFYIHPFTLKGIERGAEAQKYIGIPSRPLVVVTCSRSYRQIVAPFSAHMGMGVFLSSAKRRVSRNTS